MQKNVIVAVTGGIGAYKIPELIRALKADGCDVKVVMTESAKAFITPLTLQAISGHPVYDSLWESETDNGMCHIKLAKWADLLVIAPATANTIAKIALGMADDLLTTIILATTAKIVVAPAMNQAMWKHPATQQNTEILKSRGLEIIGPAVGEQACGDFGEGRMLEPDEIFNLLKSEPQSLSGKSFVITAGPTQEALDPVRFFTNHSSGKMGYALAMAAKSLGAEVTLISGPVSLSAPVGVKTIDVKTALEMREAVMNEIDHCDIFIACAAVADYRPKEISTQKLKKPNQPFTVEFVPNPDILAEVASLKNRPYCVGFAAQTENVLEQAREKFQTKHVDMIIANQVGEKDRGFCVDENAVTVITQDEEKHFEKQTKNNLAFKLIEFIMEKI